MQRYDLMYDVVWECESILPSDDGEYVLHSEAQAEIFRLQSDVERLKAERRMIVSHATMGATDGSDMTVNGVSCEITRLRNELYDDGSSRAESTHNDAIEAAAQVVNDYDHYELESAIRAIKR